MTRRMVVFSVWMLAMATSAADLSIENAGLRQILRLPEAAGMSGIAWKGGSDFYIVQDGGNSKTGNCTLHVMSVIFDSSGRVYQPPTLDEGVLLDGVCDAEGVACDPGSGMVWVADEKDASIGEYDPITGKPTGRIVPIPGFITDNVRGNLALESLTISADGLTMWTANEEALRCDGSTSAEDKRQGTVVRLMRFVRLGLMEDWTLDGMWAYRCDSVEKREAVCSGVSDLCVLPDGSLLVLERECSYSTLGRTRIYRPDFSVATEVSEFESLTNRPFVAVNKGEPIYEVMDGKIYGDGFLRSQVACYEGLCLGPANEDGTLSLMLVSDGGALRSKRLLMMTVSVETKPFVRALRIDGLKVGEPALESSGGFQLNVAKIERPWRVGFGGFGRGGILAGMDGFGDDRRSVYGAELDLQHGLLSYGPYGLWLSVGGAYCPQQGDDVGVRTRLVAADGQLKFGYGELRLLAIPQRRVTEDLSIGLRLGVAFDWLRAETSVEDAFSYRTDSDTCFAAQGVLGLQATYRLTDRFGLCSNIDWRMGGETELTTDTCRSSVDLSGWCWSVGAFFSF